MTVLAPGLAWPQAKRARRLGVLGIVDAPWYIDPLFAALNERGWTRGRTLDVDVRFTGGEPSRASDLARELIRQGANLIVTITTGNAVAARQATSSVPIVMYGSGYPVEAGLAKSLARPGGNVTGVSIYAGSEIWGKYVSLAREVAPGLRELAVLFDYVVSDNELKPLLAELQSASSRLKARLRFLRHWSDADLAASLSGLEKAPVEAIVATSGPIHAQPANVARIAEFALRHRLPMVNDIANAFPAGSLLAYSYTLKELAERCAAMIDRILRGANPGDLPIEFPTKFELTINMKTAKAIGLTLPQSLLVRADRVIQ